MDVRSKNKLLIVDDAELNRSILKEIFIQDYQIIEASDGQKALELIQEHQNDLAALLLDVIMPVMDGFGVLKELERQNLVEKFPVFLITADTSMDTTIQGYENGVADVIYKPINTPAIVQKRVKNVVELYCSRNNLSQLVQEQVEIIRQQVEKINSANASIIDMLSSVIEFRSGESGHHVRRIRTATDSMLRKMKKSHPEYGLTDEMITIISEASAMHDIGKISIPDYVLNKPGRLTSEEFDEMKRHTIYGCDLLEAIPFFEDRELYKYCYDICRHHHERWDGMGYPDGLKGDEISIWSQTVSIVDVYDALVSERVYKKSFTHEDAVRMIKNGECGTFNPKIVECFLEVVDDLYANLYAGVRADKNAFRCEAKETAKKKESQCEAEGAREKAKFLWMTGMSPDVWFDYNKETDSMNLYGNYEAYFGARTNILHAWDFINRTEAVSADDRERLMAMASRTTREEPQYISDVKIKDKDGGWTEFQITYKGMWNGNQEAGFIGRLTAVDGKGRIE